MCLYRKTNLDGLNLRKGKKMKRSAFSVFVVSLTMFVFTATALASLGDVVMKEEKADVLVTIEVPNLNEIFKYVDTIMSKFNQDSSGFKATMITGLFKVSDPKLIDLGKPVELIIINPKKYKNPVILAFSVTDKNKFLEDFAKVEMKLNPETKDAKIREYTKTETEFDHDAYMKDLEAEKEINFEDYNKEVTRSFYLSMVGNMAIGTGDKALMEKALAAAGKKVARKRIVTGDIQGTVNMDSIMSIYADEISMLKEMMTPPMGPDDFPFDVAKMMEAYIDALIAVVRSTETLEFAALAEDKGDIGLLVGMLPKAETTLGAFVAKQEPKQFKYLTVLPEDSAMAFGWNVNFTDELADVYIDLFSKIMGAMEEGGMKKEEEEKMAGLIKDSFAAFGSGGAGSMGITKEGFDFRAVYEVKDKEKVMKSYKESMPFIMNKFMRPMMAEMGGDFNIKYEEGVDSYKDTAISKIVFDFKFEDMPEEAEVMMKKFWGEKGEIYLGFTEKFMVMGFGPESMKNLKETLDFIEKPPVNNITTSANYISATSSFPEEGLMVFYLSLGKTIKGIMAMSPEGEVPPDADMMMQMFDKINLACYLTKKDNALVFGTKLPVSDFTGTWMGLMMAPMEDMEIEEETE